MAVADQSDSPREAGWTGSCLRNQTVELVRTPGFTSCRISARKNGDTAAESIGALDEHHIRLWPLRSPIPCYGD